MPHRRQPARHAGRFEAAGVKVGEVVAQHLCFGDGKALAGAREKLRKIREVAAIGIKRILAGPLFRRQHVEEQAGQPGIRGLAGTHRYP